ncbi:MAG: hypothetical protein KF894_00545 [Labilithrix sp.]|nr:hypothetical protein [Labilithrix sp.]
MRTPGQESGHPTWDLYVDELVREHGSLAAVAHRIAETRGFREDTETVARALRRLRARGARTGGQWGERVLATFGLPTSIDARLRFMGSYHSRFVDLPVAVCADLVQLWDRPPTSESRAGRTWLSLARATLALRAHDREAARMHLATARAVAGDDAPARIEIALGAAHVAADADADEARVLLDEARPLLDRISGADADCLRARWVGQVSHALNRAGEIERAEALHRGLPDTATTAPFARSRRANGIAYARFRHGDGVEALRHAWLAVRYAGDAGHIRMRAMALLMVARVAPQSEASEANDARARAREIALTLGDDVLLSRCDASVRGRG